MRALDGKHIDFDGRWEVGWLQADFQAVKDKPGFAELVALARVANSMRTVQTMIWEIEKQDKSPARERQMIGGFFLLHAILVEGNFLVDRLGKHFGHLKGFSSFTGLRRSEN